VNPRTPTRPRIRMLLTRASPASSPPT